MVKITAAKAESFCKKPDSKTQIFLVYGSDRGMVNDFVKQIIRSHGLDVSDSLSVSKLAIEDVRSDPSKLYDDAIGFSLLAENRIVVVEDVTDVDKSLVEQLIGEGPQLTTPVVLVAGSLAAKSKIRKLCETSTIGAAIPAYSDDGRSLPNVVRQFFQERSKVISQDAVFFLSQQLGVDRGMTLQELNKLLVYVGDRATIELEDAQAVVTGETGFFLDDLLYAVFDGKLQDIDGLYQQAIENGVLPTIVVQQLAKQGARLHAVKALVDQGTAVDRAILLTGGPLFWKVGDRFKQQVRSWSSANLRKSLGKLTEVVKQSRQNIGVEEAICHRILMSVAASSPLRRR